MAIVAKDAIRAALAAAADFYGNVQDLRLEEVQRDPSSWYVTVSFLVPKDQQSPLLVKAIAPHQEFERIYKKFEIDSDTGETVGMTIRTV